MASGQCPAGTQQRNSTGRRQWRRLSPSPLLEAPACEALRRRAPWEPRRRASRWGRGWVIRTPPLTSGGAPGRWRCWGTPGEPQSVLRPESRRQSFPYSVQRRRGWCKAPLGHLPSVSARWSFVSPRRRSSATSSPSGGASWRWSWCAEGRGWGAGGEVDLGEWTTSDYDRWRLRWVCEPVSSLLYKTPPSFWLVEASPSYRILCGDETGHVLSPMAVSEDLTGWSHHPLATGHGDEPPRPRATGDGSGATVPKLSRAPARCLPLSVRSRSIYCRHSEGFGVWFSRWQRSEKPRAISRLSELLQAVNLHRRRPAT